MPLITDSTFRAGFFFKNPHLQTIFPSIFRKVGFSYQKRSSLTTQDNDFIDLDSKSHLKNSSATLLLHGLESSSQSTYIKGIAQNLYEQNNDIYCLNFRGCSGRPNNRIRSYHSGDTNDICLALEYIRKEKDYQNINLVGFSLGGNALLKYLGLAASESKIHKAVAISVPCDLKSSAHSLSKLKNRIYMSRFMRMLIKKIYEKSVRFPEKIKYSQFKKMKTFAEFDEHYTAKYHGFSSALHYWESCSANNFIPSIQTPTLLINALDDPFLANPCFPIELAQRNSQFYLETPKQGGHVGFLNQLQQKSYWHESRICDFLSISSS